jgi:hypothetical protein
MRENPGDLPEQESLEKRGRRGEYGAFNSNVRAREQQYCRDISILLFRCLAAFLLRDGALQRITLLFHLVAAVSAGTPRQEIPAARERGKNGQQSNETYYFPEFHCSPGIRGK